MTNQPQVQEAETRLVTVQEAAERLSVSIRTLRFWIHQKRLDVVRLSPRSVRIRETELADFVKRCEAAK